MAHGWRKRRELQIVIDGLVTARTPRPGGQRKRDPGTRPESGARPEAAEAADDGRPFDDPARF